MKNQSRATRILFCVSLFLVVFGAKLMLIQRFGTSLPIIDQWDEATNIYIPFLDGTLKFANLFKPHNEHRIFFTYIYDLALLRLNGQCDSLVQMVCNAAIFSAAAVLFSRFLSRYISSRKSCLLWIAVALVTALPFTWENTLAGFQSQVYFLIITSISAILLLLFDAPFSRRWFAGALLAIMSIFTMASGFLAPAAAVAVLGIMGIKREVRWRGTLPTFALCGALIVAGLLMKTDVAIHHVLHARNVGDFVISFCKSMAWPFVIFPWMAWLNFFPIATLVFFYWKSEKRDALDKIVLALGIWVMLQAAAMAYARGAEGAHPQFRYMDFLAVLWILNLIAWFRLLKIDAPARWRKLIFASAGAWMFISILGICVLSKRALDVDIPHRVLTQKNAETNIRAFVITGDESYLAGKPIDEILYPYPDRLVEILRHKNLQKALPASIRRPLQISMSTKSASTNHIDCPPFRNCIEISGESPVFQSEVFSSDFPAIQFHAVGNHAKIEVRQGSELTGAIAISDFPSWRAAQIRIPKKAFILASVNSKDGWLTFAEPCELGILSFWTNRFLAIGSLVVAVGCVFALIAFGMNLRTAKEFNVSENREPRQQGNRDSNKFSP